jgi:hyperosmotically inducible protein
MKTRRIFARSGLACATVFAMVTLNAAAATTDANEPKDPTFQRLDVNSDGYISRDEAAKQKDFGRAFNEADENRDGRLDRGEFVKAQSIHDRLRAGVFIDDSVITARVKAALVKDPDVKAYEVSVETSKGIVLLSGFVDNERQVRRAQEVAAAIEGVKSVKSNLVVKS